MCCLVLTDRTWGEIWKKWLISSLSPVPLQTEFLDVACSLKGCVGILACDGVYTEMCILQTYGFSF